MKLRNKVFFLIGLTWIIFIGLMFIESIRFSPVIVMVLTTLSFLFTFYLLQKLLFNPIELLNQQLARIKSTSSEGKLNLQLPIPKNHDELTAIGEQINEIIDYIQLNKHHLEISTEEKINELKKSNSQLQHALSEFKTSKSKLKNQGERITQLAHYDALTTLPNRIFFNEILNKTLNHAKRHNKIFGLLFIDLDFFQEVNVNMGKTAGDYILNEIGKRLTNTLRSEDILAKLDGDEFIVLLSDIQKPKFASTVAEKLLKACSMPIVVDSHETITTASIGICIFPTDGDSLEKLLKSVEMALRIAKNNGGNIYQFYTKEIDLEAKEYIQLEGALRKAIKNNELELHYQPKLNLKKGSIVGVEVFLRWTHYQLGVIDPTKFIPLAEETGLIMDIGEMTLYEACRINKYWQDEGYEHVTISINLSPKQFLHPELIPIITKVLKETGLNPKYLELEINETTVMQHIETTSTKLESLKKLGVQIAIDHFGTGYTSISHLKQFPINTLKIDKGFINGIPQKPDDMAITSAIIALAHNLGLEVVAEGVETAEQVQFLAIHDCDMVQGYFLSHPVSGQKIVFQFKKLMDRALI